VKLSARKAAVALALGEKGGVFINGGILRHMPEYLVRSDFARALRKPWRLFESASEFRIPRQSARCF
jgi:glucokinase